MARPTLIQTLLGRPSQSYSFPADKQYHSEKKRLSAIAAAVEPSLPPIPNEEPYRQEIPVVKIEAPEEDEGSETSSDSENDVFFTPLSSPRVSLVSSSTPNLTSINVDYITRALPQASTSNVSLESTLATVSADDHVSMFSSPSASTHVTTPQSSDPGCSTYTTTQYEREAWAKDVRWLVPPSSHRERHAHPKLRHATKPVPSFTGSMMSVTGQQQQPAPLPPSIGTNKEAQILNGVRQIKRADHPTRGTSLSVSSSSSSAGSKVQAGQTRKVKEGASRRSRSVTSHTSYRTAQTSTPYTDTLSAQHLPSNGTAGYTSLILPRAPPVTSTFLEPPAVDTKFTKVDLTKTGMAHTTMASVEIMQGLSTTTASSPSKWLGKIKRKKTPMIGGVGALGFTHHRMPPSNVPGNSVLVQVWAVALDGVDATLCSSAELGYIPGRSVVGRAVEVGWEVSEDILRRGDWVIAIADVRTASALTEFLVVDRRRLHRVSHPNTPAPIVYGGLEQVFEESEPDSSSEETAKTSAHDGRYPHPASSKPPLSRSSSRRRQGRRKPGPQFDYNLEELALLPLCGVPAYRAVRTLMFKASAGYPTGASPRKKALVLNGDTGVGAMVTQMLCRRGWRVVIHSYLADDLDSDSQEAAIRANAQSWGAEEVIFGDALETIELCARHRDVFDGVVDTIGGKAVREVSYRLLDASREKGTTKFFTTVVGDYPERVVPTPTDLFRAAQRSREGGNKGIAYAWVNIAQDVDWEGQDVNETLGRVLKEGVIPVLNDEEITTLDRAPDVLARARLKEGGTVIVKVAT